MQIERIEIAGGGWLRAVGIDSLPPGAVVLAQFERDPDIGRYVARQVYINSTSGDRLRGEHLRKLPLDVLEALANGEGASYIEFAREVGLDEFPRLEAAARNFHPVTSHHWDYPAKRRAAPPKFAAPPGGRYTDEWLRTLAVAYAAAYRQWRAGSGEAPTKVLAAQAQVSVKTVQSWVYRARRSGAMPKAEPGPRKAGR